MSDFLKAYLKAVHVVERNMARESPETTKITKQHLITAGTLLHKYCYGTSDSDEGALSAFVDNLRDLLRESSNPDPLLLQAVATSVNVPHNQALYLSAALWAHCGLPQIVMGHKYAAALMSTKCSPTVANDIKSPWRAFYIELPSGLVFVKDDLLEKIVEVKGVLVSCLHLNGESKWSYFALTGSTTVLWTILAPIESLVAGTTHTTEHNDLEAPFVEKLYDIDLRAALLLGRLIVGTCLAMATPGAAKEPKTDKKRKAFSTKKSRKADLPVTRTYILGATPSIDCREAVRSFALGHKQNKGLSVQFMVVGHWRNQPYGENHSLRRIQWIEPFWKGAEGAPILSVPKKIK